MNLQDFILYVVLFIDLREAKYMMKTFKQFVTETTRPTYRVVMRNEKGMTFTHFPKRTQLQPYDQAELEVNHPDSEHAKHGPWKAFQTDRHT